MTEAEWWAMEPRERDARVEQWLFHNRKEPAHRASWKYDKHPGDGYGDFEGWWCETCDGPDMPAMVSLLKPGPEVHDNYPIRPLTTDIAAAWKVVEKMREKRYDVSMSRIHSEGVWDVTFYSESGPKECMGIGIADTIENAICLAAMKTLGGVV